MDNTGRAAKAREAVEAFWPTELFDEEIPMVVGDLICDLLHLLDMRVPVPLPIPDPPAELDTGLRVPHAASTQPVIVLARGLGHYLCEIHPESENGEFPPLDPLPEDLDKALTMIGEFLNGREESEA